MSSLFNILEEFTPPCSENPEMFFSVDFEHERPKYSREVYLHEVEAKKICSTCPVRINCLKNAIKNEELGIWGGTTEAERNQMVKKNRNPEEHVIRYPKPQTVEKNRKLAELELQK